MYRESLQDKVARTPHQNKGSNGMVYYRTAVLRPTDPSQTVSQLHNALWSHLSIVVG
jgi:hypothetical protein